MFLITPARHDLIIEVDVDWEPMTFTFKDANDVPVPIVSAWAEVRGNPNIELILNLGLVVTNPSGGEVTLSFASDQLLALTVGDFSYDMMLDTGTGKRSGPYLTGRYRASRSYTHRA